MEVPVDELVTKDHPHVGSHAFPGDVFLHFLWNAQSLSYLVRPGCGCRRGIHRRLHGALRCSRTHWIRNGGAPSAGNLRCSVRQRHLSEISPCNWCSSNCGGSLAAHFEDLRELLPAFTRQHERLRRHEKWRREPDSLRALREVRAEATEVAGLSLEVRLHLDVLAELFSSLSNTEQTQHLNLVRELAETQEPGQVSLQQSLRPGPEALHCYVRAILEHGEKNLRDAARGVGLGLNRADGHLIVSETSCNLDRSEALGPPRCHLVLHAAERRTQCLWEDVAPSGKPLRQLDERRAAAIDSHRNERPERAGIHEPNG
mmetsp:Transcript_79840/g.201861  ORF Transcript_79840/g.201861 Transcript_79840/m.201861 type:complete len:316 (-) Transcript_79840:459-1406(-)